MAPNGSEGSVEIVNSADVKSGSGKGLGLGLEQVRKGSVETDRVFSACLMVVRGVRME